MHITNNMDQGVRGYIVNTAKENFWRVSSIMDFDDLVQEGGMIWARICNRYPDVGSQKIRMGLFKTAYRNHIHDLSNKQTKHSMFVVEADMSSPLDFLMEGIDPEQDPDFVFMIKELPPAIVRMIRKLYCEGRGQTFRRRLEKPGRETTNERLCRLAGLDPAKRNVRAAIQAYLAGAQLHAQYD